jgi:hypothetical protein
VIDKPIMEMLNINSDTTFKLSTDGKNIILSPQLSENQEIDILKSLAKINKRHEKVLKKLANND